MAVEGSASVAASAMSRSLAMSQMLAGKMVQSAGVSSLRSPVRGDEPPAPTPEREPKDSVKISPEARALAAAQTLSREDVALVQELALRDTEVRSHESAHAAAGGGAAAAPSFTFERGPDGRNYAVDGEVAIDVSRGGTPEETIRKAMKVRAAALAPANPSPADRSVAAAADSLEMQARQELAEKEAQESGDALSGGADAADPRVRAYQEDATAALEPVAIDAFG